MPIRFTDDISRNAEGSDFIVRQHTPLTYRLFFVFTVAFVLIFTAASIMNLPEKNFSYLIILFLAFISSIWCIYLYSSRLRDLVMITEFQNTMLASAAQLSTRFCLITKSDGHIAYIDPGFQRHFPQFIQGNERNIDALLASAGISQDIIHAVDTLLAERQNGRVILPFLKESGEPFYIMMSIEILPRPKGYFLLRGRDYVEKRAAAADQSAEAPAQISQANPNESS